MAMHYRLRTLLILMAIEPPLLSIGWWLEAMPLVVGLGLIVLASVRRWERSKQTNSA
jgi:hypothetical protein